MAEILDASVSFQARRLAQPLQLSSGRIDELTEATASLVLEINGRRTTGRGAIYLSDVWAWPDDSLSHVKRDSALRQFCEKIARDLPSQFRGQKYHPLEMGLQLHEWTRHHLSISPQPPSLATSLCASPFDAALHDGAGRALGVSAFNIYEQPARLPSADAYFGDIGACRAIAKMIRQPRRELPAWYVAGKAESLADTLVPAIKKHGYKCFKLKITGRDNAADVARTIELYQTAKTNGITAPRLTVDSNGANPSAQSVEDYLDRLATSDNRVFAALEYLEQPTSPDIRRNPFDWRTVATQKPILLDEGLTELGVLPDAQQQGYSGLALKTCKGHSMLLITAAWAVQHGMRISLQDLTNPGIALIHGALVGAHLPTVNGAELNSPQFTPEANVDFFPRLDGLFEPRDGVHRLPTPVPLGLGSTV